MKLWYSFTKELKLLSRSYYFYIEMFTAVILLLILLFVVPENFDNRTEEYIYLDLPEAAKDIYLAEVRDEDLDKKEEFIELKLDDQLIPALFFETDEKKIYFIDDKGAVIKFAEEEGKFSAIVYLDENNEVAYTYYMQGYETERLKNLYLIFHNKVATVDEIREHMDSQVVRALYTDHQELNDKENLIPVFLTFNGSLMGLFIIAAYIFLDKKEGTIKAYAVTASPVRQYLISKVGVIIVMAIVSSLVILMPVMGLQPNYLLLLVFIITSGFFASSLGLVLTSYYKDMMQSFGTLYILILAMILPNIAYFIPSWEPAWIKVIPSYPMIQSFKEIILTNGDTGYVLMTSASFLALGILLFLFASYRFKKTLTI